jgi:tRNA threonylcarbamoyladenosine biosynthesis protein TsaE
LKVLPNWKKVYENDLPSIITELKDLVSLPAVIVLTGPVGAGKTTFTKKFVGESDEVTSPTYSIVNESGKTAHADFYRIESNEDLIHLELDLYLEDKDFFLVEWGKPFLKPLQRLVSEDFMFYELEISLNEAKLRPGVEASRNFELNGLEEG